MDGRRRGRTFKYPERSEAGVEAILEECGTLVRIRGDPDREPQNFEVEGDLFDRRASLEPRKYFAFTDSEAEISWNRECRDAF